MNPETPSDLTPLFASVAGAMRQNRDALNQSDPTNGNHGEHMLEIFNIASQVFQENQAASPAVGMQKAAQRLAQLADRQGIDDRRSAVPRAGCVDLCVGDQQETKGVTSNPLFTHYSLAACLKTRLPFSITARSTRN